MFANENAFDRLIASAAARWGRVYGVGVPVALVKAVVAKETGFRIPSPTRREPDGRVSRGPMQVLEDTGRALGITDPRALDRPDVGIDAGVHYLAQQLNRFGGDVRRALGAYNAGPGNADSRRVQAGYVAPVLVYLSYFRGVAVPALGAVVVAAAIFSAVRIARRRRLVA